MRRGGVAAVYGRGSADDVHIQRGDRFAARSRIVEGVQIRPRAADGSTEAEDVRCVAVINLGALPVLGATGDLVLGLQCS